MSLFLKIEQIEAWIFLIFCSNFSKLGQSVFYVTPSDFSSRENLDNSTDDDVQNQNQMQDENQGNSNPQVPGSTTPVKIRKQGSKKAPKVKRNMEEAEVYKELTDLCTKGLPEDKYITNINELGAGAGGTVTLARVSFLSTW